MQKSMVMSIVLVLFHPTSQFNILSLPYFVPLGAMNAMQDALAIANWLNVLQSASTKNLEKVFKEYRDERYPIAKASFKSSQVYSNLYGKVN